jgi:hypothetical protein
MLGSILILSPVVALYVGELTTVAPDEGRLTGSHDQGATCKGDVSVGVTGGPLSRWYKPQVGAITAWELEVLRLLVRAVSNCGLALGLGFMENYGVTTRNRYIFGVLDLQSRAEAVVVALRHGLEGLDEV